MPFRRHGARRLLVLAGALVLFAVFLGTQNLAGGLRSTRVPDSPVSITSEVGQLIASAPAPSPRVSPLNVSFVYLAATPSVALLFAYRYAESVSSDLLIAFAGFGRRRRAPPHTRRP